MQFEITSPSAKAVLGLNGAQLNSLKKDSTEYLWQGDGRYWAGQAPVCFPITGVLPKGRASAFGRECVMSRHGIARINPFQLFDSCKNSVTFIQRSGNATKSAFPFDYELKIKYTINGNTVTNEYIVTNTGDFKLPFAIGGHPAFNCPLSEGERFEDYRIIFDKPVTKPCLRPNHNSGIVDVSNKEDIMNGGNELCLSHSLFGERDALIFENISAKSVTLTGVSGREIRIDYQDMSNLLIWSAEGDAPFVALEHWNGISHCSDEDEIFEHKRGITILEPLETVSYKFKITMI